MYLYYLKLGDKKINEPCKNEAIEQLTQFALNFWEAAKTNAQNQTVTTKNGKTIVTNSMLDKCKHVENCVKIARLIKSDDKLLETLMLYHDVGRTKQYEIFGRFADDQILHHHIGADVFERFIFQSKLPKTQYNDLILKCIQYHGRLAFTESRLLLKSNSNI